MTVGSEVDKIVRKRSWSKRGEVVQTVTKSGIVEIIVKIVANLFQYSKSSSNVLQANITTYRDMLQ